MEKPFSQACANNSEPILKVLNRVFVDRNALLEIGSGTGQHAVYFAPRFSAMNWQPSDREENLPGIQAWIREHRVENLLEPFVLDVNGQWPKPAYDAFFTANTCHIMDWPSVENMFEGIGRVASSSAVLAIYGPFRYEGNFTTESNARFDVWLKSQRKTQGIRDIEAIYNLAANIGMQLVEDNDMPANNQLLVFRR